MLFIAAVINGVLAHPLILIILLLTSDRTVMGEATNPRAGAVLGWLAFAVMVLAALGLFVACHRADRVLDLALPSSIFPSPLVLVPDVKPP